MFKKLRIQFIIMHMGVVTIIFTLFFGAVLLFANGEINNSIRSLGRAPISALPSDDRFHIRSPLVFSVSITSSGSVVNITSPFGMNEEFYANAVEQAMSRQEDSGRIKVEGVNLGYLITDESIVFKDITREVDMFNNVAWMFLRIAIPCMFFIFLASAYFARRSIHPIETAFIKQKEFVADASHELKTPLATISANADVLAGVADEESKKWAGHIKTETGRMSSLVESLLYLAKVDYETATKFEKVELSEVMNEVLLPLEAVIHEKDIDLQVDVENKVIINGDKEQIRRLFGILVDNAIKYTSGQINICIEKIGSSAQITVQNSGDPIPTEKLAKLFDRFYRVDESHQYTGGFGLGLAIAKTIVDRHKGEITCKSDEINGTQFKVALRTSN